MQTHGDGSHSGAGLAAFSADLAQAPALQPATLQSATRLASSAMPGRTKPSLWASLRDRLSGPGGLYNLGNVLGLLGGLTLAVMAAGASDGVTLSGGISAAGVYLAGGADALLITCAMIIFFWGGEVYHRAWANGFPPDAALNCRGDVLSGIGALLLGAGLFLMGQPLLAASAGLLHAIGKFGSAWHGQTRVGPKGWPDLFRLTVLFSRFPALVLVVNDLRAALPISALQTPQAAAAPLLLLFCYLIWGWADVKLLRSA